MEKLLKILRAAHCRSTHHFFAVDAIPMVQTDAGKRLAGWLLRHHNRYLTGAKDPDTRFRDFQNHVIHVNDGYWGGAPRVAHQWYDRLLRYLREERMSDAAHAAGVLSHYFTDPIMPLHTAQSSREAVLHRPIEWSITKSYEAIYQLWKDDEMRVVFQLSDGPGWLGEAILHAARYANRKYDRLMDNYRLDLGVKDPPAGLNAESRSGLAELFGLSITGWARVIERAALDAEQRSGRPLPSTSLTLPMLMATVRVPDRLWLRRIESFSERTEIKALVDEFRETGKLIENLPAEIDIKQRVTKVYQDELRYRDQRRRQIESTATVVAVQNDQTTPKTTTDPVNDQTTDQQEPATIPFTRIDTAQTNPFAAVKGRTIKSQPIFRFRLERSDDLVDAPSIGPKTAKRFAKIGIITVADFLIGDATEMSGRLATRWITVQRVKDWQAHATLMCTLPEMLARDTQVLAGAGYRTADSVAAANDVKLHAAISKFAVTTDGKRYLRRSTAPTLKEVQLYIQNANRVQRASANSDRQVA